MWSFESGGGAIWTVECKEEEEENKKNLHEICLSIQMGPIWFPVPVSFSINYHSSERHQPSVHLAITFCGYRVERSKLI